MGTACAASAGTGIDAVQSVSPTISSSVVKRLQRVVSYRLRTQINRSPKRATSFLVPFWPGRRGLWLPSEPPPWWTHVMPRIGPAQDHSVSLVRASQDDEILQHALDDRHLVRPRAVEPNRADSCPPGRHLTTAQVRVRPRCRQPGDAQREAAFPKAGNHTAFPTCPIVGKPVGRSGFYCRT